MTDADVGQVVAQISEALRSAGRRKARWDALTPEERAEARTQAIARMPEAYRAWYLRTFSEGEVFT